MMTALAILGIIRSIFSFILLSALAYFFYKFNIFSLNPFHFALFVAILTLFAWGLGLLVSSLVFRWGSRIQVLAWSTIWSAGLGYNLDFAAIHFFFLSTSRSPPRGKKI